MAFFTNRTVDLGWFAHVFRCAKQFRMGIAYIDATQPSSLQLGEEMAAGQLVIDRGRPYVVGPAKNFRAKCHWENTLPPLTPTSDDSPDFPLFTGAACYELIDLGPIRCRSLRERGLPRERAFVGLAVGQELVPTVR